MPNSPGSVLSKLAGIPFHGDSLPPILAYGTNPAFGYSFGNKWFVSSTHTNKADTVDNGISPVRPFATIDYAIGRCTANNGDIIYVLPDHAETISAAGGITCDVAGVSIIGLGVGTDRPAINFTATGSTLPVSAANVTLYNLLFTGGVDAITTMLPVTAANCNIINCEARDVTGNALVFASFSAAADYPLIDGFTYLGSLTLGSGVGITNSVLVFTGCDRPIVRNSTIITRANISLIECRTTAVIRLDVHDCRLFNLDNDAAGTAGVCVEDVATASTGTIGPNVYCIQGANAANVTEAITGATFHIMPDVYVGNAVNEKAILINWTESTDA
jgi:hypothetical protein